MDFNDYQQKAMTTAIYPNSDIDYLALKFCGETGEIAEKIGKMIRDAGGYMTGERRIGVIREVGDVLWYCAAMAHEINTPLADLFSEREMSFLFYPKERAFEYLSLRLCEFAGHIASNIRLLISANLHDMPPSSIQAIKVAITKILACLWALAWELGSSLDEVAEQNLAKLADRAARGGAAWRRRPEIDRWVASWESISLIRGIAKGRSCGNARNVA